MAIDKDDDLVPRDSESCLAQTGLQHLAVALCLFGWQVQALVDSACINGCQLVGRLQCLGVDVASVWQHCQQCECNSEFRKAGFHGDSQPIPRKQKKTRLAATF